MRREAKSTESDLKSLGRSADVAGSNVNTGMSRGSDGVSSLHDTTTRAARGIVLGVGLVGAALGAASVAVGAFGLKTAASLQQTEIAFTGLLGSGEKAKAFLGELSTFAAKTPFELPQLADAARQLLGAGYAAEEIIPMLTSVGDAAANLGISGEGIERVTRALTQMKGKGRASAEEILQITEAMPGFNAMAAIAAAKGISVAEATDLMAKGAISADEAIPALIKGMQEMPGAAGAMERQALSLNGVLSTLKDTFSLGLAAGLKDAVPAIAGALNNLMPFFDTFAKTIGQGLGGLLQTVLPVIQQLMPVIAQAMVPVMNMIGDLFTNLGPVIAQLAPVFVRLLDAVMPFLNALEQILAPILSALLPPLMNLITVLLEGLTPVLNAAAPVLGTLAKAFADLAQRFVPILAQVFDKLAPVFVKVFKAVEPLIPVFADALMSVLEALMPIIPIIADGLARLAPLFATILRALEPVIPVIADLVANLIEQLAPVLPQLIDAFIQLVAAIVPLLPPLVKLLAMVLQLVAEIGIPVLVFLIKTTAAQFQLMAAAVSIVSEGLTWLLNNVLLPVITFLRDNFIPAWIAVRDAVVGAWEWIKTAVTNAWNWLRDNILNPLINFITVDVVGAWNDLRNGITGVWNDIKTGVQNAIDEVKRIIDSVMGAIEKAWNEVWDRIKAIPGQAIEGAKALILTPLRAIRGFLNVMISGVNTILGALKVVGIDLSIPEIPEFHSGGPVPGRGEVPARLLGGEYVLSRPMVKRLGGMRAVEQMTANGEGPRKPGTGGIFDDAWSVVEGAVSAVGNALKDAAFGAAQAAFAPVREAAYWAIDHVTPPHSMIRGLPKIPIRGIDDFLHQRDVDYQRQVEQSRFSQAGMAAQGLQPGAIRLLAATLAAFPMLHLTSGFRPGDGNSFHATGQAIDVSMPGMADSRVGPQVFDWAYSLRDLFGVIELISQHRIYHPGSGVQRYDAMDHFDHVHLAAARKGLKVGRRPTLAMLHPYETVLPKDVSEQLQRGANGDVNVVQNIYEASDPAVVADVSARRIAMAVTRRAR